MSQSNTIYCTISARYCALVSRALVCVGGSLGRGAARDRTLPLRPKWSSFRWPQLSEADVAASCFMLMAAHAAPSEGLRFTLHDQSPSSPALPRLQENFLG